MRVCPNCRKVIGFNSYFGAYICDDCGWEDSSYNEERISYFARQKQLYEREKALFEAFYSEIERPAIDYQPV